MKNSSLAGHKIIVTGGSRGIGAGIVQHLADCGAEVAFTYSSREESAQAILAKLSGSGHFCVQMNIADEASVQSGLEQILKKWPEIHGLVNNAGITKDQLILRMKTDDFDSVINTNLKGTFLLCRALSKLMVKARRGSIVNITSVIGQTGNAGQSNYAASKAGTIGFSKSLAQELGSRGIRVNCIAPGFIATEMTEVLTDEQKGKILEKIPLQKMGETQDIASSVRFLLSDESKYITGHTLSVNGGMFMQ